MSHIGVIEQTENITNFQILDKLGNVLRSHCLSHKIYYSSEWIELDAVEVWQNVRLCIEKTVLGSSLEMLSIGLASQCDTVVCWNRLTGKPYHRVLGSSHDAIGTSNENITAKKINYLMRNDSNLQPDIDQEHVFIGSMDSWLIWNLTAGGMHVTGMSSASRTQLMNVIASEWDEEILSFHEIPKSVMPRIIPCAVVVGSVAATTICTDMNYQQGSPKTAHPDNTSVLGSCIGYSCVGLDAVVGVKIAGIVDVDQARLVGYGCFRAGDGKITLADASSLCINTDCPVPPHAGDFRSNSINVYEESNAKSSVRFQLNDAAAPVFVGDSVICENIDSFLNWTCRMFGCSVDELECVACSVSSSQGVYWIPPMHTRQCACDTNAISESSERPASGCQGPGGDELVNVSPVSLANSLQTVTLDACNNVKDAFSNGWLVGFDESHTRNQLLRATLEAQAYQVCSAVLDQKCDRRDIRDRVILVEGERKNSQVILQTLSDILQCSVFVPSDFSFTDAYNTGAVVSPVTLGVLFLSGCAMDLYSTFQAFQSQLQSSGSTIVTSLGTKYTPSISPAEGDAKLCMWRGLVQMKYGAISKDTEQEKNVSTATPSVDDRVGVTNTKHDAVGTDAVRDEGIYLSAGITNTHITGEDFDCVEPLSMTDVFRNVRLYCTHWCQWYVLTPLRRCQIIDHKVMGGGGTDGNFQELSYTMAPLTIGLGACFWFLWRNYAKQK